MSIKCKFKNWVKRSVEYNFIKFSLFSLEIQNLVIAIKPHKCKFLKSIFKYIWVILHTSRHTYTWEQRDCYICGFSLTSGISKTKHIVSIYWTLVTKLNIYFVLAHKAENQTNKKKPHQVCIVSACFLKPSEVKLDNSTTWCIPLFQSVQIPDKCNVGLFWHFHCSDSRWVFQ